MKGSASVLASNPIHHNRTNHIDAPYCFIRYIVSKNKIHLPPINTKDNAADALTNHSGMPHATEYHNTLVCSIP